MTASLSASGPMPRPDVLAHALIQAHKHADGRVSGRVMTADWALEMVEKGWRAEHYARAARWVRAALPAWEAAQIRLVRVADATAQEGHSFPPEIVEPWLAVLAGAPDHADDAAIAEDLLFLSHTLDLWMGVPIEMAAVGYAAGLSPDEVRARCWEQPGRTVFRHSWALAALRGWRLPADAFPSLAAVNL